MNSSHESFSSIPPAHPLLNQHIAYYYFHQTFADDFRRVFTYYPNYRIALNVFRKASIQWSKHKRLTLPDNATKQTAIITFSTQGRRDVHMHGRIHKIGIVFEPMGINHFIDVPIQQIIKEDINNFDFYGSSFFQTTEQVFDTISVIEKRDLLDAFFIRHFQPFPLEELLLMVTEIMQQNGRISVADIAKSLQISRKTLLRIFKKHLVHSIRDFSNLVRFRNALQLYKKNKGHINLTQLAYESQFYDQSAFIKSIKSFTGLTPKKLFYQQEEIGGENTFWTAKP